MRQFENNFHFIAYLFVIIYSLKTCIVTNKILKMYFEFMLCFCVQAMNVISPSFIEVGANVGLIYNNTEDFVTNKVKSFTLALIKSMKSYINYILYLKITIANEFTNMDDLGISIYSGSDVSIIGVKSDRGSTDAFLALRTVTSSKEYVVALWP